MTTPDRPADALKCFCCGVRPENDPAIVEHHQFLSDDGPNAHARVLPTYSPFTNRYCCEACQKLLGEAVQTSYFTGGQWSANLVEMNVVCNTFPQGFPEHPTAVGTGAPDEFVKAWKHVLDPSQPWRLAKCPHCGELFQGTGDLCSTECFEAYAAYINGELHSL
jgi:predicted nucleic acid-binding Zn ribbon protein